MEKRINRKSPLLFSHRGGAGLFPENTLFAFKQSVERFRADILELDIHLSADGEMIVLHDETVDRTTDGIGTVSEMTLAEIKRLDAGWRFTDDGGKSYPYRGKGLTIPTLKEVFEAFQRTDAGINIEIKRPYRNIENKLYNLITGFHMAEQVVVTSAHPSVTRRFRALNKRGIATGADAWEGVRSFVYSKLHLGCLYRPKCDALQLPLVFRGTLRVVTEPFVSLCKSKDIKLHVWTIDDRDTMRMLLDWKVDGIISDYPDRLYQVFQEYGYR